VKKGVLTVRDNEHNVTDTMRGDEVMRQMLPSLGNAWENPQGTDPVSQPYFSQGWWHYKSNYFDLLVLYLYSTHQYKLIDTHMLYII
jgi:hypothetical protein